MTSDNTPKYNIIETHCYPNRFKIERVGNFRPDNGTPNFFPCRISAIAEIFRRGGIYCKTTFLNEKIS